MDKIKIARINELAKKQRELGLSQKEIKEQADLRKEYIEAVRSNLRAQLLINFGTGEESEGIKQ